MRRRVYGAASMAKWPRLCEYPPCMAYGVAIFKFVYGAHETSASHKMIGCDCVRTCCCSSPLYARHNSMLAVSTHSRVPNILHKVWRHMGMRSWTESYVIMPSFGTPHSGQAGLHEKRTTSRKASIACSMSLACEYKGGTHHRRLS